MIKSIEIKNFQAHKKTIIELHKNITVIRGLSDSGKSSFIRSIDCVLRRKPFYMRYTETEGSVAINYVDGRIVSRNFTKTTLQKCPACKTKIDEDAQVCLECGELVPVNPSSDYYMINADKREKFGVKLPDYITEFTRINPILFVDKEIFVSLAKQHDDFFFIGQSYDNLRNKMISSLIVDSDKVDDLLKTLNSEKYVISDEIRINQKELKRVETKLDSSEQLYNQAEIEFNELEESQRQLADMISRRSGLIAINAGLSTAKITIEQLKIAKPVSEKLATVYRIFEQLNDKQNRLNSLKMMQNELTCTLRYVNINHTKFNPTIISEIETVISSVKKIAGLKSIDSGLKKLGKLSGLKIGNAPAIDDISSLGIERSTKVDYSSMLKSSHLNKQRIAIQYDSLESELKSLKEDICKSIDDSICPITNDKYCESCIKSIKYEYSTRTDSKPL